MADIKTKYPATSSVALTITLASLATDANRLTGREATAVDNTSNNDLDHMLAGQIMTGTSPTAGSVIEVWVVAPLKTASGTPFWPDGFTGSNAAKTLSLVNIKDLICRPAATIVVDGTSNRAYPFGPVSIAGLFGAMPKFWLAFVTHNNTAALNSTGGNHFLEYERIQAQTV